MYPDGNDTKLQTNQGFGTTADSWVRGWLDWTSSSDNTNILYPTDDQALLAPDSKKTAAILVTMSSATLFP